jgi:hypothetical protein
MSKKSYEEQQFQTDIGSKALVEHHNTPPDEHSAQLREVLADIGRDLQATGKVPKELTYKGSFSVHVYQGSLNNFAFAGVHNPDECPHPLADAAAKKLAQDIREHYFGRRQKLRSGF